MLSKWRLNLYCFSHWQHALGFIPYENHQVTWSPLKSSQTFPCIILQNNNTPITRSSPLKRSLSCSAFTFERQTIILRTFFLMNYSWIYLYLVLLLLFGKSQAGWQEILSNMECHIQYDTWGLRNITAKAMFTSFVKKIQTDFFSFYRNIVLSYLMWTGLSLNSVLFVCLFWGKPSLLLMTN